MQLSTTTATKYDEYSFGKYIRQRREALGFSYRALAAKLEISAAYLCEIESGHKKAPLISKNGKNYMQGFITYLQIPNKDIALFYEMANATRYSFPDIHEYLENNRLARAALRLAKDLNLSDKEWQKIILSILEIKSQKR